MVEHPDHRVRVRAWHAGDVDALTRNANFREVSRFLRDRFPYPYTREHAIDFIERIVPATPLEFRTIEVDGEPMGGIGIHPGQDVHRRSGELGYWLTPALWRRRIMSAVVNAYVRHRMAAGELVRVSAMVYESNVASHRLLERCGFVHEGRLRRAIVKHGELMDAHVYAYVDEDAR